MLTKRQEETTATRKRKRKEPSDLGAPAPQYATLLGASSCAGSPSRAREPTVVHHGRVVPTLALTSKQALPDSGVTLRLVLLLLHPGLQDAWVRKID